MPAANLTHMGSGSAMEWSETMLQGGVPTYLLAVAVFFTALAIRFHDRWIFSHSRPEIPTAPGAWPIIGNTMWFMSLAARKTRMLDETLRLQKSVGKGGKPFTLTGPAVGGRITVINRPEYIQYVQKTNFENFNKGKMFSSAFADVLGLHGIFVADGEPWKKQRKMASHIFSVGNFRTHVQSTIQGDLETMRTLFNRSADMGVAVDLPDVFFRFTLSSFGTIAFSAELECLPSDPSRLHDPVPFAQAFDFAQLVIDQRFVDPLAALKEPFSSQGRKMRASIKLLNEYCYKIIDLRLAARAQGSARGATDSKAGKDLLELFMDQGLDRHELLPVVLNFIIAGRDTTAQSLAWCFYEFWKNPKCMEMARKEILSVLGSGEEGQILGYDGMKSLLYVHACFYEAIRLHPSVAKNMKVVQQDDVIRPYANAPDADSMLDTKTPLSAKDRLPDIPVRKGETVTWQDWTMARMPEIWGDDCEVFKPERFIETHADGSRSLKNYGQYKFHAFNAGPRLCLGQTLATYEGMATIAIILANFDIIYDDHALRTDPPTYADSVTHPIKNPYHVRFARRA